jgi:uncharacterized protein (DUF302 family)
MRVSTCRRYFWPILSPAGRGFVAIAIIVLGLLSCTTPPPFIHSPEILRVTTEKTFADVVEELEFAITEHNFRITGRNRIGQGIRKRGHPEFPDIEIIHFCSLEYAREVLAIDPGFVVNMPCRVAVHQQGKQVVVSIMLLPENHADPSVNDFARRMNRLVHEIVDFAVAAD